MLGTHRELGRMVQRGFTVGTEHAGPYPLGIQNMQVRILGTHCETLLHYPKPQTRKTPNCYDPAYNHEHEPRNPKPDTSNTKPETSNPKLEPSIPKPETSNPKLETRAAAGSERARGGEGETAG